MPRLAAIMAKARKLEAVPIKLNIRKHAATPFAGSFRAKAKGI